MVGNIRNRGRALASTSGACKLAACVALLSLLGACAPAPRGSLLAQADLPATRAFAAPVGGLVYKDMPPGASQVDYGKEAYRLVCAACHAYDGKGLTSDWVATWAPQHQNCWQSKCHSASHPPDGFVMPTYVPEIMGEGALSGFATAKELHDYLAKAMPYQDPGYMTAEEYWNLTAYLLSANKIDPGKEPLNGGNAARVKIGKP